MTSWSGLYETALFSPLAEQLVDAAGIGTGMRVLAGSEGSGILTRRLALTVGPRGSVTAVAADAGAAQRLAQELGESRTVARIVVASVESLPLQDREFDAAASLLGPSGAASLRELERVAHSAAAVVRDGRRPLPEELLARAWQDVTGAIPPGLSPPPAVAPPDGWTAVPMGDVARFDGVEQLLMSLCDLLAVQAPPAVRRRFAEGLAAFQAADGTLRIPVEVTLLRRRSG